uniref:Uncharacterized protein n=1 Tax=Anopheles farauti TaxID=69004 RepID=A0A182QW32_9DIPT
MSTVPSVVIDTTDSCVIRGSARNAALDEEETYRKLFSSKQQWSDDAGIDIAGSVEPNGGGFLNSTLINEHPGDVRPSSRSSEDGSRSSSRLSSSSLIGSGTSEDDYKGGLLATADESGPSSISSRPSDSSRGFQNTFTVLERHLQSKHFQFRQLRRFLQYNESSQTPVFCNAPPSLNDSSNYLRSISEESAHSSTGTAATNGCSGGVEQPTAILAARRSSDSRAKITAIHHSSRSNAEEDEHDRPSFLELELEASDRLRRLRERLGGSVPDLPSSAEAVESPLTKALYGISLESLARNNTARTHPDPSVFIEEDEDKRSLSGEYPDYPYYVARGSNGLQYLKVVRNASDGVSGADKGE